tara:strand:- start:945 stop:1148 length:204 start_codon:yes stop_codon:yes gene_type:complete
MKKNIKFIIIITVGIITLYFTKDKYEHHSLNKSIMACVIAQKNKSPNMNSQEAKKYCLKEIEKKKNK